MSNVNYRALFLSAAVAMTIGVSTSLFAAGTLPDGYTEVEYIQGSGNARINTGYTPNPTTDKVEAVVQWPDSSSLGNNQAIWCARTGGNSATWTLFKIDNQIRFDYKATTGTKLTPAVVAGPIYTNTVDRNVVTWSGSIDSQTHITDPNFTAAGGPLMISASYTMSNGNPGGWGNYGKHRLYYLKVWRSDELIHYYVPCTNASGVVTVADICLDNPVALTVDKHNQSGAGFSAGPAGHFFDDSLFTVDDKFEITGAPGMFGSPSPAYGRTSGLAAGETVAVSCGASPCTNEWGMIEYTCTGWKLYDIDGNELDSGPETSFTYTHPSPAKGRKLEWQWTSRKIAVFPTGYTECECIVVTNAGQYIDTLYNPNLTTDVEAHFEVPNFTALNALYWTRKTGNFAYNFVLTAGADSTRKIRTHRLSTDSGSANKTLATPLANDIRLSTAYSGGGAVNTFTFNGETQSFDANSVDSLDKSIYIFRLNDNGTVNTSVKSVVGTKLYSFKILENGVVQREFVPCLREADSVAGLYDIQSDDPATAFYVNQGTGGSFGYEAKDTSTVPLTVIGSHSQPGTPFPTYGTTNLTAGVSFVAEMPQTAVTNYLTGEERELLGWTLAVTRSAVTETTHSTDFNRQRCAFTPQEGDTVTLTWRWTTDTYGARTLPAEYEAADYLEITAFDRNRYAFVDTKYIPSLDDSVVASFDPASTTYFLFCSRESNTMPASKPHMRIYVNGGKLSYMCGTGSAKDNLGTVTEGLRTSLAISGRGLYKDGEEVDARFGETALEPEWPLTVGASYNAYDSAAQRVYGVNNALQGNIYAFKVWSQDGTPRVDLRPCTRKADGAKGLYDTVRNVFCPLTLEPLVTMTAKPDNLGVPTSGHYGDEWVSIRVNNTAYTYTAQFQAGEQTAVGGEATYEVTGWELVKTSVDGVETVVSNDISNVNVCSFPVYYGDTFRLTWFFSTKYLKAAGPHMPQRYSEAEWIEFPGDSYILTDYVPHPDRIRMQVGFQITSYNLQSTYCQSVFSARSGGNSRCYTTLLFPPEGQSVTGLQFRVSNRASNFWTTPPMGEQLTLCTETNTVWVKDRTEVSAVDGFTRPFTEAGGLLMFGATYNSISDGVPGGVYNYSTMRLFGAKVWENGAVIHDYRPCFDRLTGISGLYDMVDGVFFPNAAGTHFVFGKKTFGLIITVK